jgi:hypothetical protein
MTVSTQISCDQGFMVKYLQNVCLIFLIGMATMSCGEELNVNLSLNEGYRVFGLRVEPPVARPDDKVIVTAYDHHPKLENLAYSWSLCLYSHGASSNYECLSEELLLPLYTGLIPRIILDFSEKGINLRTRLKALGQALDVNGKRRNIEDGLDLFIILKSGDPREGLVRSVKRLRIVDLPGDEPLASNPRLQTWTTTESGVTNQLPTYEMRVLGPETSIEYNDAGELLNGTLRSSVITEINGQVVVDDEATEEASDCVLHTNSLIDVNLKVTGSYDNDWSTTEGYTYRWYISDDQKVLTPISVGGIGKGRFEVIGQNREVDLFFSVRDPQGGFTMGRQLVKLVPGISTRN